MTTSDTSEPIAPAPVQRAPGPRFATSRSTLVVDRCMTWFVTGGGLLIIVAVFGICAFIIAQVAPLARGARVSAPAIAGVAASRPLAVGVDEWGAMPFVVGADGGIAFVGASGAPQPFASGIGRATVAAVDPTTLLVAIGGEDGRVAIVRIAYEAVARADRRSLRPTAGASLVGGFPDQRVDAIAVGGPVDDAVVACVQDGVARVARTSAGAGAAAPELPIDGRAALVVVDERGDAVVVANDHGYVWYFERAGDAFRSRQPPFRPFADGVDPAIAAMGWLFGDQSVAFVGTTGANAVFGLYPRDDLGRVFGPTHVLDDLPEAAVAIAHGTRNKAFAVVTPTTLSLRYGTTAATRWQSRLDYRAAAVAFSAKGDAVVVAGEDGSIHRYGVDDPHPEADAAAFFRPVWYEGSPAPAYTWQSSAASDDVEPKLSLVPLLFGTLKGTFYALVVALPIALLAAVYCAEFMDRRVKQVVKPTMEIMASLPSVVLGFLAAQWLAPRLELHVPSVLLTVLVLPLAAIACGWIAARLPPRARAAIRPGSEWLALVPVLAVVGALAWSAGPLLERVAFGGDFRAWWPRLTGAPFEQRNSLVVGFMMGFAVIPIIFTIADDALSNVPASLRSGSLALGATRWQTAMRVVLPTASAGVFSAIMIGLGRAIGETMIVVMATGNTPIMSWNIFDGMRTITATIATELPEAAVHGTLYRTLFLGALLLFGLTFVVNTAAELLRQHLRDRFKTV